MKKILKWALLVICMALVAVSIIYVESYYHADKRAISALESDSSVEISQTDYGWFFDGPSEDNVIIFYPGGKVEETAYAPLLHELAGEGMDACLVKMPLRLAILGKDKAGTVMEEYDYDHWYIAGHSLGGACAAMFAAETGSDLDGIVMLASYSTEKLDKDIKTVFIYGSEDGVLNMEKYEENRANAPAKASELIIEGGNHSRFGSYGHQKGDGKAFISRSEQTKETVNDILEFIKEQ